MAIPTKGGGTRRSTILLAALGLLAGANGAAQNMMMPKASAGLMPSAVRGKALYQNSCASCHGADLKGSAKGPPMLHQVYEPSHHGDGAFQLAAKYGSRAHHWQFGDMPAVPAVTPDDVAHITAFVRLEQRKAGIL